MSWSSSPKNGKVYGTRNIVEIKNGKGVKVKESLNKAGAVLERKKKTLKSKEIKQITSGTFVPNLWSNCQLASCKTRRQVTRRQVTRLKARAKTRKHRRN
jgi:hypothetical protein